MLKKKHIKLHIYLWIIQKLFRSIQKDYVLDTWTSGEKRTVIYCVVRGYSLTSNSADALTFHGLKTTTHHFAFRKKES